MVTLLKRFIVGPLETNCYIIQGSKNKLVIIDPGFPDERILNFIDECKQESVGIILTHGHYDHICGVKNLVDALKINIYAHPDEIEILADPYKNFSSSFGEHISLNAKPISDDFLITSGFDLKILHLPGHTPGGIGLVGSRYFFSGDTVFAGGGVGRTDLPDGNSEALAKSIRLVATLPDELILCAGHGGRSIVGREKKQWLEVAKYIHDDI